MYRTPVTFQHSYSRVWKGCVWIFAFAVFMCVPFGQLGSVWLSPRVPGDDPHPVVTIVMMLSALPCALMCTLPRKTPTAGSHIPVKDKNRGGGGGWYWWDIECNQSTVTLTGTEGLDGMVNKGDKKTKVLQPSPDLLHNSARSSWLNLLKCFCQINELRSNK